VAHYYNPDSFHFPSIHDLAELILVIVVVAEQVDPYACGPIKLINIPPHISTLQQRMQHNFDEYMKNWKFSKPANRLNVHVQSTTRGRSVLHACLDTVCALEGCKNYTPVDCEEERGNQSDVWEFSDCNISDGELEDLLNNEEEYDSFVEWECDGEYGRNPEKWLSKEYFEE
jgi:hypothetical protein